SFCWGEVPSQAPGARGILEKIAAAVAIHQVRSRVVVEVFVTPSSPVYRSSITPASGAPDGGRVRPLSDSSVVIGVAVAGPTARLTARDPGPIDRSLSSIGRSTQPASTIGFALLWISSAFARCVTAASRDFRSSGALSRRQDGCYRGCERLHRSYVS